MILASSNAGDGIVIALWVVLGIIAYWMPTFIALARRIDGLGQVIVVNLFLGWSVIGWVVALVMAFRHVPQKETA